MNILRRKFRLLNQQQSGLSMIEILVGVLVTGLLAFGGTMATVQILQQARSGLVEGENVRGVAQLVHENIQEVAPGTRPFSFGTPKIYSYALIALDGPMVLDSNTLVRAESQTGEANVYAKGNIQLKSNSWVQGDATATGAITLEINSRIDGTRTPNLNPPEVFEQVNTSLYEALAAEGGTRGSITIYVSSGQSYALGPKKILGNLVITGDGKVVLGGTVWVTGYISIDNTRIEGSGAMVAVGNIEQKNNSVYVPNDIPMLISTSGDIFAGGNGKTSAILYAPNGTVTIDSNREIYGTVIAKSISGKSNAIITYPIALQNR